MKTNLRRTLDSTTLGNVILIPRFHATKNSHGIVPAYEERSAWRGVIFITDIIGGGPFPIDGHLPASLWRRIAAGVECPWIERQVTGRRVTLYAYHAFFRETCLGFARSTTSFLRRKAREPLREPWLVLHFWVVHGFTDQLLPFTTEHDPKIVYTQSWSLFPWKSAAADVITLKLLATDCFSTRRHGVVDTIVPRPRCVIFLGRSIVAWGTKRWLSVFNNRFMHDFCIRISTCIWVIER